MPELKRCAWAKSETMVRYHDQEWGVPLHDDRKLFEFICLEGAQAGLSWETILNKRENYRNAFDNFQPEIIAKYNERKIDQLLGDAGIVRNRLKIASVIKNAKAFLMVQKEFGSFDKYIWQFAPSKPGKAPKSIKDIVARTADSDRMSKDLQKRGFNFVGSTICYAFMQAVGIVNDHAADCFRRKQL
ncbi:MAG TPA: DNA-3-methyladenine glycosylase I [Terriglobales bacterium]